MAEHKNLFIMCSDGNIEEVRKALAKGGNPNKKWKVESFDSTMTAMTALHIAVIRGHKEVVALLLEQNGIDLNAEDSKGLTALHTACDRGHQQVVALLLEQNGIDLNAADKDGTTALYTASAWGYTEVVALLLAQPGILVNAATTSGDTALRIATDRRRRDVVALLLEQPGILVNAANSHGWTVLHIACLENVFGPDILRRLLSNDDTDPNVKDENGDTAIMLLLQRDQNMDIQGDCLRAMVESEKVDLEVKDQEERGLEEIAR